MCINSRERASGTLRLGLSFLQIRSDRTGLGKTRLTRMNGTRRGKIQHRTWVASQGLTHRKVRDAHQVSRGGGSDRSQETEYHGPTDKEDE